MTDSITSIKGVRTTQTFKGEPAEYQFYFYGDAQSLAQADDSPFALDMLTFLVKDRMYVGTVSHKKIVSISTSVQKYATTFDAICDKADLFISAISSTCCILRTRTSDEEFRSLRLYLNDLLPHITNLSQLTSTQCYEIADALREVVRKFDQIIYPIS